MNWKDLYRAALVEVDPARRSILIADTEAAISLRSESLSSETAHELQEMGDATCTLGILKNHAIVPVI